MGKTYLFCILIEMSSVFADNKVAFLGNHHSTMLGWNRKLCFESRDTLFQCVDSQENKNKYRCPDELYAYEMWCPPAFRRIHASRHRAEERDDLIYTKEGLAKYNKERQ